MNKNNFEEIITNLYKKILKREPDKTGLYFFVTQVKNKKFTIEDVENILSQSDEAKSLNDYSHYSDKYWNDLEAVRKYKNKLSFMSYRCTKVTCS